MLIVVEEDEQVGDTSKGNFIAMPPKLYMLVCICHLNVYFVVMAEKSACNVISISLCITRGEFLFIYLGCFVYFSSTKMTGDSYVTHLSCVLTSKISIHILFEESQAKHMQFFK